MKKITLALLSASLFLSACSTLLQPTTCFDRRRVAKSYGKIVAQTNPDCENCTDTFLVEKKNGCIITLIIKYDGRVEVIDY
jgi:hypothetical protein